jgi:hypothetical protein
MGGKSRAQRPELLRPSGRSAVRETPMLRIKPVCTPVRMVQIRRSVMPKQAIKQRRTISVLWLLGSILVVAAVWNLPEPNK